MRKELLSKNEAVNYGLLLPVFLLVNADPAVESFMPLLKKKIL